MEFVPLEDSRSGLRGVIALDARRAGPAFGGIRMRPYADDDACRADAARLAEAMTFKCAFHDLPGTGGKCVVRADCVRDRGAAIEALARAIDALDGRFFTGPDVGFGADDVERLARLSRFVTTECVSDATARGVVAAIEAACAHAGVDLPRARVRVQGLGEVGLRVAQMLGRRGADVAGWDVDAAARERAARAGVRVVDDPDVLLEACEVAVPCALGGAVDARVVEALRCRVLAGAANNVLEHEALADRLHERGIVHVPDFVANAGGVVRGALAWLGHPRPDAEVDAIGRRTAALLAESARRAVAPLRVARERVEAALARRLDPERPGGV